jgi:hypothetical protein
MGTPRSMLLEQRVDTGAYRRQLSVHPQLSAFAFYPEKQLVKCAQLLFDKVWPSFFLRSKATLPTRFLLGQIPSQTFPLIVQLLAFESFRSTLLAGLVISVGGLADSLGKASASALLEFLQTRGTTRLDEADQGDSGEKLLGAFADSFRALLESNAGADRVILPALKVRRNVRSHDWVTSVGRGEYRCRTFDRMNLFLARPKTGN